MLNTNSMASKTGCLRSITDMKNAQGGTPNFNGQG